MQYSLKKAFNFIKFKDILHLFIAAFILPYALIAKIFIRDFWLICEDRNEARDNGYWLFKWIRENKPKQKISYAIDKKSSDYDKVKKLGKIIRYGTLSHWFWYIVADKNISSQKGGKPNAAVCYLFEVVFKMRKNNRIFLQHGVIMNDLKWLYYNNCYFKMFCCSAKPEYEYVSTHFGYPEGIVKCLGLTRFDGLHDAETDNNLILVMPSWRNWISREGRDNQNLDFLQTEYFRRWNEFLNSPELMRLLEKYNKKLLFYPHRNMQKFLGSFSTNSNHIEIADCKKYDIQDVLKRAALMITDYSSVFFDFAYMCKPVIFYQFDEKEFREKQYGEGYLDYHDTVLGSWSDSLPHTLELLEKQIISGIKPVEEAVIRQFFPLWDNQNCKRTYESIASI